MTNNKSQLFIPKTVKVGFQKREDTFLKTLAYIIYYDAKGVLRKEKSWEGWRDKKIEAQEFENTPHSGFVLNKGILRCGHWGSGHNNIRIYDDRGFEFEISVENLLFVLMNTNCHKRGLEGNFVYAWQGTELVLLPEDCDEYRNSSGFSSLQGQKVSARDLILGASYETKKQEKLTYLGKFDWYDTDFYNVKSGNPIRKKRKKFVFVNEEEQFVDLLAISSLSRCIDNSCVENYADLLDKFSKKPESSKVVEICSEKSVIKLCSDQIKKAEECHYGYSWENFGNFLRYDPTIDRYSLITVKKNDRKRKWENNSYTYLEDASFYLIQSSNKFYLKDGELFVDYNMVPNTSRYRSYNDDLQKEPSIKLYEKISLEELEKIEYNKYFAVLESGEKVNLTELVFE